MEAFCGMPGMHCGGRRAGRQASEGRGRKQREGETKELKGESVVCKCA